MPRDPLDDPDLHVMAHILDIRDDTYHIIGAKPAAAWSEKGLRGSYSIYSYLQIQLVGARERKKQTQSKL